MSQIIYLALLLVKSSATTYTTYPTYIPILTQPNHLFNVNCGLPNNNAHQKNTKIQNKTTTDTKFSVKSNCAPAPPENNTMGKASAIIISKILLPKTFEIAILAPCLSFRAAMKLANASGALLELLCGGKG